MLIGAVVRLGPASEGGDPSRYADICDMAMRIEDAGLDSIWIYDHLLYRWPGRRTDGIWEAWSVLSALAQATRRVRLGTLVMCTAFRNPALLAKMACTVDEISDGRLILGLGAGWHQPEFDAFGVPFDHRASRFQEALEIICPLLRDGRVDFHGRYHSAPDCEIVPRGPRAGGPPILVAGSGPRMLRYVARYADSWNTAWHAEPKDAVDSLASVRAACEAEGRQPASLEITVGAPVAYPDLGPDPAATSLAGGGPERVAATLRGFAELGVAHLMAELTPYTPAALERFARAVQLFRT